MDDRDNLTDFTISREQQKARLRRSVIESDDQDFAGKIRSHRIHINIVVGVVLLVVLVLLGIFIYRRNIRVFDGVKVISTIEENLSGTYDYVSYGENVVYYGKSSATYVGADGKPIWSKPYEMNDPVVALCGDYIAIADRKGTSIVICNEEGCTGTATTTLPISRIAVAGQGMVAVILEDDVANYIRFYNKSGTKLNIEIKTLISGDGYPLDLALSPSGEDLMVSYVNVQDQGLKNKIMFYNFDVGQDQVDKLIAGYEHYTDTLIPRVAYLNEDTAVAIGDNLVSFFHYETESTVDLVKDVELTEETEYVFMDDAHLGLVCQNPEDKSIYLMNIYDGEGNVTVSIPYDTAYDDYSIYGNEILCYNAEAAAVYYLDGKCKFSDTLESNYSIIRPATGRNQYITFGNARMQIIETYLGKSKDNQ